MKAYTAVIEQCADTGMYVGYVPGFPGAHSQAGSLDELNSNLKEVIEMLLAEGGDDSNVLTSDRRRRIGI
jgi:predicted RNase H-like HicB family nuclease